MISFGRRHENGAAKPATKSEIQISNSETNPNAVIQEFKNQRAAESSDNLRQNIEKPRRLGAGRMGCLFVTESFRREKITRHLFAFSR